MSKNKKVILATIGVLLALILAVLLLRNPQSIVTKEPVKIETSVSPTKITAPKTSDPNKMDKSHQQVANIIDDASKAVTDKLPSVWSKMKDYGNWVLELDTKHAIILIAVIFIVVAVLVNGSGSGRRRKHG